MPGRTDPTIFPLREGGTVPRDLVAPYTATLGRRYGGTLESLAERGGISVYELWVLLQAAPSCIVPPGVANEIYGLTVVEAMRALSRHLADWEAKRAADAEAAMLAMFEEGAADESAQQSGV